MQDTNPTCEFLMGITGLLPLLKPVTNKTHLRDFAGKTIVIDGHSWIHKSVYGSGLALFEGKEINAHVAYCIKRLAIFFDAGVIPLLVFDGGNLPMKATRELERKTRRDEARQVVSQALKVKDRRMAWEYANRCVDVTPAMVSRLVVELQARKISYIVAPYEADAQMAFLVKNGFADAVVSEDSDMLLFGCPQVIFKLSADGTGDLIRLEDISKVSSFQGLTHVQFRQACILSGCDYLPSLPKLGMGTAIRLMQSHKGSIESIFKAFKSPTSNYDSNEIDRYIKSFMLAELTFCHQRIWNPKTQSIDTIAPLSTSLQSTTFVIHQDLVNVLINPDTNDIKLMEEWPYPILKLEFLGPLLENAQVAAGIAMGAICPITKQTLNSSLLPTQKEIFSACYVKKTSDESKKVSKLPWRSRLSLKPDIYKKTIEKENVPPQPHVFINANDEQTILSFQKSAVLENVDINIPIITLAENRKKSPYFGTRKIKAVEE